MRKKRTAHGLTVNAVAGTHVVLLGLDLANNRRAGCLGFAIRRDDHTEDERDWMSGMKTFRETDSSLGPGGQVSSRQHPFQSFHLPNVVVAVAKNITMNSFDRWLKELPSLPRAHVKYIHTKYMLVDLLGDRPLVVTGSANFSKASTNTNNENMIVIRNDKRVVDIYLGEFMRLYSHYAFREAVAIWHETHGDEAWAPNYFTSDDSWQKDYFTHGHASFFRRRYFAGG